MTRAELLAQLQAEYLQRIERIAEQLEPRFRAGELRGFNDADGKAETDARHAWMEEHPKTKCRLPHRLDPYYSWPCNKLFDEVVRRLRLRDDRNACLVVAVSPSTDSLTVDSGRTLAGYAGDVASWDVLRVARERRWYKPHRSETPTNEELGIGRRS
jgi:hypothetical protein